MKKTALVLGGADAGLYVARKLADLGHPVALISYPRTQAGTAPPQTPCYPDIHIYQQTELVSFAGKAGDFTACFGAAPPGEPLTQIRAGAIVLTVKSDQTAGLPDIAGQLGIALNDYGLVATNQFCPVLTSRDGIFVVDGGKRMKAEILSLADKAATMAAYVLEVS